MNKKVWIISHYAGGPSFCPRLPDYILAQHLMKNGYDVLVFASSAVHNTDINFISDSKISLHKVVDDVPFVFVKTRSYKNKKDRVFNMLDFYRNMMKCYRHYKKPDLIVSAMPQPLACLAGWKIANRYKIPYVTSIVDLWPLSIVEYAGVSNSNPIIKALYMFEKWIYRKSDALVFTWEGAYDYIIDKGWSESVPKSKFHYINIGVNLKEFYHNLSNYHVDDSDLEDDTFKVMYCGSVRTANDINTVVSCAKELCDEGFGSSIKFIIYGDGPDRPILTERCKREGIPNVVFKGNIDKKYIPFVLSKSDLCILNLLPAATQKYGNSSNKLFEYLASGSPVIANIDEGNYPIITKYECGKVVKAGNIKEYADGVKFFYEANEQDREKYRDNAFKTAKIFDTEELNANWLKLIDELTCK